jgi:hypothetical protein
MNRQIRRAQEKSDKQKEREREKRKSARVAARQERRTRVRDSSGTKESPVHAPVTSKGRRSGVFAGAMALMTAFFIVLQAFRPAEDTAPLDTIMGPLFYVLLGYFTSLWLMRRGTAQAIPVTLTSGIVLATVVEALKFTGSELAPDPLIIFLAVPGLIVGVLISRFVHQRTY